MGSLKQHDSMKTSEKWLIGGLCVVPPIAVTAIFFSVGLQTVSLVAAVSAVWYLLFFGLLRGDDRTFVGVVRRGCIGATVVMLLITVFFVGSDRARFKEQREREQRLDEISQQSQSTCQQRFSTLCVLYGGTWIPVYHVDQSPIKP